MLPELVTSVPGPESLRLAKELRAHESRNVTYLSPRWPVFWQRAKGTNVWDVDGNRFLDLGSAFGVAGLGHAPDPVVEAIRAQAGELYHGMGDVHPTAAKAELCRRLSALTYERWTDGRETGKVLLGCNGGDAVEAALKTAFMATRKGGVLAFFSSYHGLNYGPLTHTGIPYFRYPFSPQLPNQLANFVEYPHCQHGVWDAPHEPADCAADGPCARKCEEALRRQFQRAREPIGAILVEPVQGRGGDIVPPDWFLPLLRRLADEMDCILIADEIFTGFHRTGKPFAVEHSGTVPDLVCLGKALTGGFPLSACVGRAKVMDAWPESEGEALHTSTFLGNPLGCRMALAALDEMAKGDLSASVAASGRRLMDHLRTARSHVAVDLGAENCPLGKLRGLGLMIGMEVIRRDADGNTAADPDTTAKILEGLLARGVLLLASSPDGNVLSFTPPFTLTEDESTFAAQTLEDVVLGL